MTLLLNCTPADRRSNCITILHEIMPLAERKRPRAPWAKGHSKRGKPCQQEHKKRKGGERTFSRIVKTHLDVLKMIGLYVPKRGCAAAAESGRGCGGSFTYVNSDEKSPRLDCGSYCRSQVSEWLPELLNTVPVREWIERSPPQIQSRK